MDTSHTARVRLTALATALTGTKYDYAELGCCCQRAAQRELGLLHEQGKVWISGWAKRYYQWIPIYSPGNRKDIPKPPPVSGLNECGATAPKTPNSWSASAPHAGQREHGVPPSARQCGKRCYFK